MNKSFLKIFTILFSLILGYILVFFYFYVNFEKDFKKNIKNKDNLKIYKKFSPLLHHIRYADNYRFEKKGPGLIFNFIKNQSGKKIILFQGDSWFEQINDFEDIKNKIKEDLPSFSKIINAGITSYSPSLINAQFNVIENYFKIKPDVLVIYIDQTDLGDELCRYRNLLNLSDNGELINIEMERFPYYSDTFNLHEKITLSEIEQIKINKIIKTQIYLNYKVKKSYIKIKKRIQLLLNSKSSGIGNKCHWQTIENFKISITDEEEKYFKKVVERLFYNLNKKEYIEKIFVVTHPHKLQLTTNKYPIDVSNIIKSVIKDYKNIEHINFSKIIKENKNFYSDLNNIWLNDNIHLNDQNYKKFVNKIIEKLNEG